MSSGPATTGFDGGGKARHFVDIAEMFLEDDQTIEADDYINRAAQFIAQNEDPYVTMRFKVSYARILDSKRRFLDAAVRYYELSCIQDKDVREEDLTRLLEKAVICAILAAAGPRRSRMLGTLHKDARTRSHLPLHMNSVLEQVYRERLLRPSAVTKFNEALMPHQKARLGDGSSGPARPVGRPMVILFVVEW